MTVRYTATLNTNTTYFDTLSEFTDFFRNLTGFKERQSFYAEQMNRGEAFEIEYIITGNATDIIRSWNTPEDADAWFAITMQHPVSETLQNLGWTLSGWTLL